MASVISVEQVTPVFYYRPMVRTFKVKTEWVVGFLCAIAFHVALVVVSSVALVKPVEFAVEQGFAGMELQLVAGVEEPITQPQPAPVSDPVEKFEPVPQELIQDQEDIIPIPQEIKQPEQLTVNEPEKMIAREFKPEPIPTKPIEKVVPLQPVETVKGNSDMNATMTGSGALVEMKPEYLSNPAPKYPLEAKRKGWAGTVLLRVSIGKGGDPFKIEVKNSSGYDVLDESAVATVRKWKFRPKYVGDMPIDAAALVPVKFNLENAD
ncbi:MAG: energy transducer TonB [Candidatus Omnitrophica bacterium]|nr:energy transducer TonB [Candidatus Omnitrophota bacterium]